MIRLLFLSAVRSLKKNLTLSTIKITGLSVGVATFLVAALYGVNEWSFDKQHEAWDRIYRYVHRVKSQEDFQSFAFTSATTGPALKERFSEVEDFTRILRVQVNLKRGDADVGFVEKNFAFADPNFTTFFSFPLQDGNDPKILDEPYAVILTPASAKKYFGDQNPIGKTLLLNAFIPLTVKGILRTDFERSHMKFAFVASFGTLEAIRNHPVVSKQIPASLNLEHKGFNAFYTYLRFTSAEANISLEEKFPAFIESFRGEGRSERLKPYLQSLASIHLGSDLLYEIDKNGSVALLLIYVFVGFLILVTAIINYINISTAEFLSRAQGYGLKKILGVSMSALLLGHMVETLVICAFALLVGVFAAFAVIPYFNEVMQTHLTVTAPEVLPTILIVYAITAVLSGLLPAVKIIRQDALGAMRGEWKSGRSSVYLRNSLVFLQLTVSFVLLALALLIVRQTDFLLQKDTGLDADQVMVVNTDGMTPNERLAFRNQLKSGPDVTNVSMCSIPPGEMLLTLGLTLPGAQGDEDRRMTFYQMFVDENFLATMGVEITTGRFFDAGIPSDSVTSIVINETAARALGDSAMQMRLDIQNIYTGKSTRKGVVGIMRDFHFASFHTEVGQLLLEYNPRYARYLLVRFNPARVQSVVKDLEQRWREHAPLLPFNYSFLDDNFAKYYLSEQRTQKIVSMVSLIAICLASLGIFGTSLFVLQQRTKEIGIRKMLGSDLKGLFVLLFQPIFLILLVASAVGIPLVNWSGNWWLAHYPYHVKVGIMILGASFCTLLLVMLATVSLYLTRIARIQPAQVLRSQ